MIADLDGFKQLNDRYGHASGDEALVAFANVLAESLRKPDDAFRIGGDEFAVLLAEATEEDARQVVARVETLLEQLSAGGEPWARRPQRELRLRRVSRGRERPADAVPPRRRGAVRREAERHRAALRRARVATRAAVRLPSGRAEGRPERARLRRARHLRARRERPLRLARLLDRRRLPRRARRPRRRLALHRAPAVQGLAPVRRAGDRGDVRRDGRRAERRDLAREHRRLRARPRPPRRDGARGDDRHGLRALLRRGRPGARGRARGDRDVRGHAAGARARPLLGGRLRRPPARTAGDRHRRGHLLGQPPRARRLPPHGVLAGERRRRRGREPRARPPRRAPAAERAPRRRTGARGHPRPPAARAAARPRAPLPAQGDRAVPPLPRRDRHLALGPPPLRRLAARLDPRRVGLVAPLPGDPREARHGVRRLQLRGAVHGHRHPRRLRRHARGEPRRVRRDLRRADRRDRGRPAAQGRARAREGEPQGADRPLARIHLEPHEPAREVARHRHGAPHARARDGRDRGGRGRRARRAGRSAAAVRAARGGRGGARRVAVPLRRRAARARASSERAAA